MKKIKTINFTHLSSPVVVGFLLVPPLGPIISNFDLTRLLETGSMRDIKNGRKALGSLCSRREFKRSDNKESNFHTI